MTFNLKEGMKNTLEIEVEQKHTAEAFGSGSVKVLATPMMIALMEKAALKAVQPALPEGYTTVGISLNVNHIAATPVGMKVFSSAELVKVENKKLTFKVEAFDEKDKIGEGIHERYIIETDKFLKKTEGKLCQG